MRASRWDSGPNADGVGDSEGPGACWAWDAWTEERTRSAMQRADPRFHKIVAFHGLEPMHQVQRACRQGE
jgi:hypothetical protein